MPRWPFVAVGHRHDDHHAADPAVRDERLGAVEHPALALPDGRRPHAGGVAAGAGLGEAPGAQHFAAHQPRQELLFLRVVPNIEMCAEHRPLCAATESAIAGQTRASSSMQMQ